MAEEFKPILLTKESWMSSQLSVAKYTGGIQITGEGGKKRTFLVVNKEGKDLNQVSIPAGEPADLVDKEFIPLYKKLGRYYLIDNNLWEVYEGRLALDAQEDNYYDKLEDMPTAISFVLEQQKAEEKKAKEEAAAKGAALQQSAFAAALIAVRSQLFHHWLKSK